MLDAVFPQPCVACGSPGWWLCAPCRESLTPARGVPAPPGVDAAHALVVYEGAACAVVTALKYRNLRAGVSFLGEAMAALVAEQSFDLVTWAPTDATRRRARGFDQAELLARATARALRRPCRPMLRRPSGSLPQTGRSAADRRAAPTFAVAPTGRRPRRDRVPPRVLLVDDVMTTGATMSAAACALRQVGPCRVVGLALAHTPLKVAR